MNQNSAAMKLLWVFPILIVCIAAKQQLDWTKTYTGYPQPLEFEEYIKGEQMFTCDGPFALCSFAGEFRGIEGSAVYIDNVLLSPSQLQCAVNVLSALCVVLNSSTSKISRLTHHFEPYLICRMCCRLWKQSTGC